VPIAGHGESDRARRKFCSDDSEPVGPAFDDPRCATAANVRYGFDSVPGGTYYLHILPNYSPGGKYAFTIQ
jgi:hypothetical protein